MGRRGGIEGVIGRSLVYFIIMLIKVIMMMTMTRSLVYIIPAIVTAVVVSGPRFLEVETADICLDLRSCDGDCDFYQE